MFCFPINVTFSAECNWHWGTDTLETGGLAGCCASVDQLKENGLALLRHVSSWWVGTTLSTPTGGTSVLSIERFVGLKSGISLMHEVLMQTIRPRSWDKREMGTWCMFPRNWRIQSWKAWLCISTRKEKHILKHRFVHSNIPAFHKDLLSTSHWPRAMLHQRIPKFFIYWFFS